MKTREYLKSCSLKEFKAWLEPRCIFRSFYNIENGISFRVLILNDDDIFLVQYKNNLEIFKDALVNVDDDMLNDKTRFFIFSYIYQLESCCIPDDRIKELIKRLKADED